MPLSLRANLRSCLIEKFLKYFEFSSFEAHEIYDLLFEKIKEPSDHWQQTSSRGSRRYLFSRDLLEPLWMEEDMRYDPDYDEGTPSGAKFSFHDLFDSRLKEKMAKLKFLRDQNSSYFAISNILDAQVRMQVTILNYSPSLPIKYRVSRAVDEKGVFKPGFCELCFKAATTNCSRCKKTFYCSREHQREDWKNHKKSCR